MSVVVINVLTVPEGAGGTLEQRFAARAGLVEGSEGFEGFQLLRPTSGTDRYLVVTRWRSQEDFQRWLGSADFGRGHAQAEAAARHGQPASAGSAEGSGPGPASSHSEIWQFDVVQDVTPRS